MILISDALLHKGGELSAVLNVFQGQEKNRNAIIVEGGSDWYFWNNFIHDDTKLYAFSNKKVEGCGPKTNKEAVLDSLQKIANGIPTRTRIERLPKGCMILGIVDEDHDILLGTESEAEFDNPQVFLDTTRPFRDRENMLLHYVETSFDVESVNAKELVRKIGILRTIQQKKRRLAKGSEKVRWNLSFKEKEICQYLKDGDIAKLIERLRDNSRAHEKIAPVEEWLQVFDEGERLWKNMRDSKIIQGHDWVCGIVVKKFPTVSLNTHFKKHEREIEIELTKEAEDVIEKIKLIERIRVKEEKMSTNFLRETKKH